MKTAISIEDSLLLEADETARRLGLSRSRLFALAVGDFVKRERQDQMLRRLNEVYADGMSAEEKLVLKKMKAKAGRTVRDRW
jgi:metal-responsive CopG/Arc/MetJ family transcriptional regulator